MPRFQRRPQFQQKANVPMVAVTRDRLAIEIRMAGETLINRPSIDSYNTLSKMFAALERAGMASDLLAPGSKVMNAICDRYDETRTIIVEREEAACLRQTIANIDAGLHRVPLQRFALAVAEVEVFSAVANPSESIGTHV